MSLLRSITGRGLAADVALLKQMVVLRKYREYNRRPIDVKWAEINAALAPLCRRSSGNTIEVYYDSGDSYRSMWQAVEAAKTDVRWQTYICKDDATGRRTIKLLEEAHARGVKVELLYDCGGNITGRTRLTQGLLTMENATVIRYRPFFLTMWAYVRGGMHWQDSPSLRNHRKILVVDGAVGFAGGLNIGDDYCDVSAGGNGRFRDTQCRVEGPAVKHLTEVYEDTLHPRSSRMSPWRSIPAAAAIERVKRMRRRAADFPARAVMGRMQTAAGSLAAPLRYYAHLSSSERRDVLRAMAVRMRTGARFTAQERSAAVQLIRAHARHYRSVAGASATRYVDGLRAEAAAAASVSASFAAPAVDTDPIPEAAVFADLPPTTQVLMCNPLTLDWSLPMAMWLVTSKAHRRVWVTTPYYLPHLKLTSAIITAARRGVDVRIVAGSRNTTDPWFMWYASQFVTQRFLQAGVKVYEFDGGQIMHAKTVVVDSVWSSVGSYNWDVLSNKLLEVSVTSFGTKDAAVLEDHFRRDMARSKLLTLEEFTNRGFVRRLLCCFFYYGMRFGEKLGFWNYYDPHISTSVDDNDR